MANNRPERSLTIRTRPHCVFTLYPAFIVMNTASGSDPAALGRVMMGFFGRSVDSTLLVPFF